MNKKIVVTYKPGGDEQAVYHEIFDSLSQVRFLPVESEHNRSRLLSEAEIIIALSFSAKEIAEAEIPLLERVGFIQLIYAGADNVPLELIPPEIVLASNVGAFARPIAEHVLALTLALAKMIVPKYDQLRQGIFDRSGFNQELRGAVCGIIGFGGNGREIARTMRAMGMQIYGINRSGQTDFPVDFIGSVADLPTVLQASRVVVVTTPLTRATKDLIGSKELDWMKNDAMLINVGRGDIVNQQALYEHLKAHPNFCAGIDTWWDEPVGSTDFELKYPFFELPNIIGSPHIADHVPGSLPSATRRALENVRNFLVGNDLRGVLNREDYLV